MIIYPYINSYKKQHVSPDRSKLISLMTPTIMNAKYTNGLPYFFRITGLPFTGQMCVGATGSSMFIYDETTAIYHEAYTAARADMKA